MLKPAILYKEEIQSKMLEYNYTEDMMYYSGYLGSALPSIEADTNGKLYQYVIVNDGVRATLRIVKDYYAKRTGFGRV